MGASKEKMQLRRQRKDAEAFVEAVAATIIWLGAQGSLIGLAHLCALGWRGICCSPQQSDDPNYEAEDKSTILALISSRAS